MIILLSIIASLICTIITATFIYQYIIIKEKIQQYEKELND